MRTYPQFAAARLQYLDPQNIAAHPRSWTAGPAVTHTVPIPLIKYRPYVPCTIISLYLENDQWALDPSTMRCQNPPQNVVAPKDSMPPIFPDALQASGIIPRQPRAARYVAHKGGHSFTGSLCFSQRQQIRISPLRICQTSKHLQRSRLLAVLTIRRNTVSAVQDPPGIGRQVLSLLRHPLERTVFLRHEMKGVHSTSVAFFLSLVGQSETVLSEYCLHRPVRSFSESCRRIPFKYSA